MTTFVLVHGAWHGGWCWREVAGRLQSAGHRVFAPTLTGLADRSHLLTRETGLETHILDIVNLLEWEELDDAVLCGHSYGGMVVTGAADRAAGRLRALVYLDAFVPGRRAKPVRYGAAGARRCDVPGRGRAGRRLEGAADAGGHLARRPGAAGLGATEGDAASAALLHRPPGTDRRLGNRRLQDAHSGGRQRPVAFPSDSRGRGVRTGLAVAAGSPGRTT